MTVFRETTISWGGQDYTFTPSMKLLRQIETQGISLMAVAFEVSQGRPQASLMATILAIVMRSAGVPDVDEEQLLLDLSYGDMEKIMLLYQTIMLAIMPQPTKKPDAPQE